MPQQQLSKCCRPVPSLHFLPVTTARSLTHLTTRDTRRCMWPLPPPTQMLSLRCVLQGHGMMFQLQMTEKTAKKVRETQSNRVLNNTHRPAFDLHLTYALQHRLPSSGVAATLRIFSRRQCPSAGMQGSRSRN